MAKYAEDIFINGVRHPARYPIISGNNPPDLAGFKSFRSGTRAMSPIERLYYELNPPASIPAESPAPHGHREMKIGTAGYFALLRPDELDAFDLAIAQANYDVFPVFIPHESIICSAWTGHGSYQFRLPFYCPDKLADGIEREDFFIGVRIDHLLTEIIIQGTSIKIAFDRKPKDELSMLCISGRIRYNHSKVIKLRPGDIENIRFEDAFGNKIEME